MPAVKSYFLPQKSGSGSDQSWNPAKVLVALTLLAFQAFLAFLAISCRRKVNPVLINLGIQPLVALTLLVFQVFLAFLELTLSSNLAIRINMIEKDTRSFGNSIMDKLASIIL